MSNSIFRKDGTAQGVAKQRLIESIAKPAKRVVYDPLAERFVTGAGMVKLMGHKLNTWITKKLIPGFHEHLIARTRFIDDLVEQNLAEGIEQYVILGAGYDLRAHRLKLPVGIQVFEVDQLEVQERKRAKLPADLAKANHITYVSIDFNKETLSDQLLKAGFDPAKSAIFTLEGVSQYITKEAVQSTLSEVSMLMKADVVFYMSYVKQALLDKPELCFGKGYSNPEKKAETVMNLSARVGEPWISFYTEKEIAKLMAEFGFTILANNALGDLNEAYFGPVGRALKEDQLFNLEQSLVVRKIK